MADVRSKIMAISLGIALVLSLETWASSSFAQATAAAPSATSVRATEVPPVPSVVTVKLESEAQSKSDGSQLISAAGASVLSALMALASAAFVGWMTTRSARQIEALRVQAGQELETLRNVLSSDQELSKRRAQHYEHVLALLKNLPKYPEQQRVSAVGLQTLANALRDWYFDGAGLYMNVAVREAYFDLQDGIRLILSAASVLRVRESREQLAAMQLEQLKEHLDRRQWQKVPKAIDDLLHNQELDRIGSKEADLADSLLTSVRRLGSTLRSAMCSDLASRRELPKSRPTRAQLPV
jgi:hypothetical protein